MVELRLSPSDAIQLLSSLNGTPASTAAANIATPAPASNSGGSSPLSGVTRVSGSTASSARGAKIGTQVTNSVSCPSGRTLLGGGATVKTSDGKNTDRAQLSDSYASDDSTWTAVGVVSDANLFGNESLTVTAVAICA
jgi:hypothetical protein